MPTLGVAALGIATAVTFLQKVKRRLFGLALLATLAFPLSYFFPKRALYTWDSYFSLLAWLVAATAFLAARKPGDGWWKALGFLWCFGGALIISMTAYERDLLGLFYVAILIVVLLLIVLKRVSRLGTFGHQAANTFLILLVGLPIADCFTRPAYFLDISPDPAKKYYSFEGARKDPSAFRRWWPYYVKQWNAMGGNVYMRDPDGKLPFRLKPGSEGWMFNSKISINSLGFRGKEIPREKGGRISHRCNRRIDHFRRYHECGR
jgi:hypothetical protein